MANNAKMYNAEPYIQAGINPYAILPRNKINANGGPKRDLAGDIRKNLRIMDEQDALHRYKWYGLPKGLNAEIMERVLYYRGQGALFRLQDKFFFLPYALNGTIDCYGRFMGITPLPFNGSTSAKKGEESPFVPGLTLTPYYEMLLPEDYIDNSLEENELILEKACVLLHDYSPQISQTNIARQILNEPILDVMSEMPCFMRTALLNATGVMGMRVGTEGEQAAVDSMSEAINRCALEGRKYTGIIGNIDFQELTGGNVAKGEEFFLAMQSLDNFRLSLYGLDNGGLAQKKAHMLQEEQDLAGGATSIVYEDGLYQRQMFATIANSIWGTEIWCEPAESVIGVDRNGDMVAGNDNDTSTSSSIGNNENGGNNDNE